MPSTLTVVSGGQTGVDRAALDAALSLGIPCGGWCPEGRLAEDGPIPARYPLRELSGADYFRRTRQNVIDSDGTLIVTIGPPSGGTARTIEFCKDFGKPLLEVDAAQVNLEQAAHDVRAFVIEHNIRRLNVAGPRASAAPAAYDLAFALLRKMLNAHSEPAARGPAG
jgi:putative molybdenum carrier protein